MTRRSLATEAQRLREGAPRGASARLPTMAILKTVPQAQSLCVSVPLWLCSTPDAQHAQ